MPTSQHLPDSHVPISPPRKRPRRSIINPPPRTPTSSHTVCAASHSPLTRPPPPSLPQSSSPQSARPFPDPIDLDFPSPPPLSSDEDHVPPPVLPRTPATVDASAPSTFSQDSVYFKFPNPPTTSQPSRIPSADSKSSADRPVSRQSPYYTRTFDHVISQVLARYTNILRPADVTLANALRQTSADAYALFVRVYRRKQPAWYRVSVLQQSYAHQIQFHPAIQQLSSLCLFISTVYATSHTTTPGMKPLLARELLSTLRRSELQAVCSSLVDGKSLRKLSKTKLLPTLSAILTTVPTKSPQKKRLKQTTLSGLSPAQCLANAVLKTVGHSLRIPDHVLLSLKRIHFLFFLEDGHLSPNLILADTGKVKFPTYLCRPMTAVFPSSFAFEQYEKAIELEEQLDSALEEKRFEDAASLGSIAELELRQFFNPTSQLESSQHTLQSPPSASQSPDSSFDSDDELRDCQTTPQMKAVYDAEAKVQLKHPFFRRYTAQWVYVRACAHSVQALERLSEFETAVTRLKLLLSTQLMPKRRGKCLNRLTINMFKHLALLQEPLDIIVAALLSKDHLLRHGDRNGLAKRGIAIDKKMGAAAKTGKEKTGGVRKKVARRSKSSPAEDRASCPAILLKTLERVPVKVNVRKVYGKSLNVQSREEHVKREERLQRDDPWKRLLADNSRDSFMSSSSQGSRLSIMGKSKFCSFRSGGGAVSVEEYCLEWYFAKQKWCGSHDEGKSVRFLFALFLWECALFAPVSDVFQTPYQDRPLDLFTEAFYGSRKEAIDKRLVFIASMTACDLFEETVKLYEMFEDTRAIGCVWNVYSAKELATVSAGLGGAVLSHCFKLLAEDYAYWGAGLPDLTLWRMDENDDRPVYYAKLVEVKSARDNLSERQRAWLVELSTKGGACEVCKVVEKLTAQNSGELEEAQLDSVAISALDKYLSSSKD